MTVKSVASKLATPLLSEVASSPAIVIVWPTALVLIPSPAASVRVWVRILTEAVPLSVLRLRVVAIGTVPAESRWPLVLTLKTGIADCEPYVPATTFDAL